jgi:hypothetical protein
VLRGIAGLSLVYDVSIGVALGWFRPQLQAFFSLPAPQPPIHADLNAIFVIFVGLGYLLPLREPVRYRAYLWVFGVGLKYVGALAFLGDYFYRQSPASLLLFALSDAVVASLTLAALRLQPHATSPTPQAPRREPHAASPTSQAPGPTPHADSVRGSASSSRGT